MKITEYKFNDKTWILIDDEKCMKPLAQEARKHFYNMVAINQSLASIHAELPGYYSMKTPWTGEEIA